MLALVLTLRSPPSQVMVPRFVLAQGQAEVDGLHLPAVALLANQHVVRLQVGRDIEAEGREVPVVAAQQAAGFNFLRRLSGQDVDAASPNGDRRFADTGWNQNPLLAGVLEEYLARSRAAMSLVETSRLPEATKRKAKFAMQLLNDAFAPSNVPWMNPVVVKEAMNTGGASPTFTVTPVAQGRCVIVGLGDRGASAVVHVGVVTAPETPHPSISPSASPSPNASASASPQASTTPPSASPSPSASPVPTR